jgi:rRNA maturation protein Nop10
VATIRATCSDCGDVHLTTAQVTVRIRRRDARGAYTFHCPDCGRMTVRPADRETLDLLVASGVPIDVWELPDELGGVLDRPPLNDADLASFLQLLDDDAAFEDAVAELLADGSDGASTA